MTQQIFHTLRTWDGESATEVKITINRDGIRIQLPGDLKDPGLMWERTVYIEMAEGNKLNVRLYPLDSDDAHVYTLAPEPHSIEETNRP